MVKLKPQNKWPSYYIERLTNSLENLSDVDREKAHTSIKLIKKSVDCYVAEIKLELTDGWHMVRKVDKTKLLTVVGIIIFLFGGAVRIFSHLTSSADNYI